MTSKRVFFFEREYLRNKPNDVVFTLFQAKLGFVFQHWRKPRNQNMSNTPDPSISGKKRKKFETFQTISASKNIILRILSLHKATKKSEL